MRLREIKLGVEVNVKNRKSIGKTFRHLVGKRGDVFDVVFNKKKIETVAVRFFSKSKDKKIAKVYYFKPSELTFVHSSREKMKAFENENKQITHVAVNLKANKAIPPMMSTDETIVNRPRQMGKNTELRKELEKKSVFSVESLTKPKNENWCEVLVLKDISSLFKAEHNDPAFMKNIIIHDYENKKDFKMVFQEITQPDVKPVEEKPKKSNLRKIIFIELFIAYILFLAILLN